MRLTIKEGNRALRGLFCGIVLLVAAACRSQIPIRVGADMAGVLRDNNFLATDVHSPLQPTGDPGLEPKDGTQFVDLGQSNDFQYRHADTVRTAGPILFLEGDCLFLVRGYRVSCDSVQYDRIANTATLRGHVHVDGELFAITQADAVTIDFANNSYIAKQGEAQLTPKLVQGRLRDKIYVKGRESYGTEGLITTRRPCDNV